MKLTQAQLQELAELEELEALEKKFGQAPTEPGEFMRADGSETIEEMHPSITAKDRAIIKNLSQSPEAGEKFLREKYPNLEVGHEGDRMFLRTRGDKNYYVLDPDTGFLSKDILNDATDIGYDVASSVADTAGAALGAGAGLISPVPGGALMGGMAGAAATGAGTEALRQKLGQMAGLPQEVDPTDVVISGGVSGLTAGLAGTAPLKSAVNKYAHKKLAGGLSKEAVQELIDKNSQGLAKKGYNYTTRTALPWVASKASGIDKGLLKSLGGRIDELTGLEKSGINQFLRDSRKNFSSKFNQAKSAAGEKIDEFLGNVKGDVDITKAKGILQSHIQELEQNVANGNAADVAKLEEAKSLWNQYFTRPVKEADTVVNQELGDSVDAQLANRIKGDLTAYAETHKNVPGGIASRHGASTPVDQKMLMNKADDSRGAIVESLEGAVQDPGYKTAKLEYGNLKDQEKNLGNMFKSDKRYYRALRNLSSPANEVDRQALESLDKLLGTKSLKDAEMMQLYSTFAKPSSSALSVGGATSTSRTIPLAVAGGTLGSLGGYQSGGGYSGAAVGGGAGATLGAALGSPAALKFAVKRGLQAEKYGRKITPKGNAGQVGAQSIWEMLRDPEED